MGLILEVNYSKKLGLPGYSSHQYSVTLRTELADIRQVEPESARLYALLQGCVDRDIQQTGFLPVHTNGNGSSNGNGHPGANGSARPQPEAWACSDKQRSLILKIVEDNHLDKADIESLACERFGKGVRQLNKMEASGLIDELLEAHGNQNGHRSSGSRFQKRRSA